MSDSSIQTLLIGLDGATFTILDAMVESGWMPRLRALLAGGARAPLRSIIPPLTPPAWTSLMTGRTPGHHGVFDFFRRESAQDRHIRFFTSHDVKSATIFDLASQAGLRVTALNFPSMFPPPRLNGYIVPGWVPWRELRLACWPESLMDFLKTTPGFNPRELAMDIQLEEKTTEGCADPEQYAPWIELHTRRERNWFHVFRRLTQENPSDLTAVLFDGVDKLQHLCWRFLRLRTAARSIANGNTACARYASITSATWMTLSAKCAISQGLKLLSSWPPIMDFSPPPGFFT
jgi:predicted AlkP superfamily phosphohydrolase/phosphomutase